MSAWRVAVAAILLATAGIASQVSVADPATRWMVATADERASGAAAVVLEAGGSALDAAIAIQAVLGLVEPQSSGLGGGAFLLYWDAATGSLHSYDGRETAPAAAGPDYFLGADGKPLPFRDAMVGGRSVGVPGAVAMLELAHRRHGRLAWSRLFDEAAALAERGFVISPRLAASIAREAERKLGRFPVTRAYFLDAGGAPRQAGERLANPDYAATVRAIATGGAEALRRGPIAEAILAAARDSDVNPAVMTAADLAGYRAKERPPVCVGYRAYKVCGMGPPSSGGLTVGQILGLLSGFDLAASGPGPASAHLFAEASRLAYADRAQYMADPDFVSVPARGLLDPDYLASRAARIDRARSMGRAAAGLPPGREGRLLPPDRQEELPGTSHFVVRDAAGNAVSMTTTVESAFGSGLMAAGFILNNELTDFSFRPEEDGRPVANRVAGGKRPRSSMAPTIVFRDGAPYLLIGSPGGSQIIGYVAWAAIGVLDFGLDPQAAIDMGHVANQNGATGLEAGTAAAAWADQLGALGHEVQERPFESGLQAILIRSDGSLVGGVDRRREGTVAGR